MNHNLISRGTTTKTQSEKVGFFGFRIPVLKVILK